MVCLGNICRSPLAQGILQSKVSDDVLVDSAGTANYHVGEKPDKRSVEVAKKHGIDITSQRGRQFSINDFDVFDVIYVMDDSNYKNVITLAKTEAQIKKVKMILNELYSGKNLAVPDPYYGGNDGFENVYAMLDKVCDVIAAKIN